MASSSPSVQKRWSDTLGTASVPALGFIEVSSIAKGLFLTDLILKKAPVTVITSQPISSGKHVILYFGDVASVEASHREALDHAETFLIKEALISGVHEDLVPFLDSIWESDPLTTTPTNSVGVVESLSLAGAILAADTALKTAQVSLCRMRLGQGIGGKAYFVLSGRQDEIQAALEVSESKLKELECFCRKELIARPQSEVFEHF